MSTLQARRADGPRVPDWVEVNDQPGTLVRHSRESGSLCRGCHRDEPPAFSTMVSSENGTSKERDPR